MRVLALSAVLLAASAVPSAASVIGIEVFDNGVLVGSASSASGVVSVAITTDPAFDSINVAAAGEPFVAEGDLSSAALNVTSSALAGAHTLNVEVFQTGITIPIDIKTNSVFTTNNLIGEGGIGPTTESTFLNGTTTTLGTLLQTHTFPLDLAGGSVGPLSTVLSAPATADAEQYIMHFTGPDQSADNTIQLTNTTVVPEASTWAMLLVGAAFMGWGAWARRKVDRLSLGGMTA
jgi:hypothetical protein